MNKIGYGERYTLSIKEAASYFNIVRGDKIRKMLEFAGSSEDCQDPWYTNRFNETYNDVVTGCKALLEYLVEEGKIII